ncbi:hypothetical protein PCL_11358 [Purpureocillium lilacinum]|uniref:Uncharacterized protein n=1 Tax=Purpureocillium lilacinum TaxID=33203 RepID=A0A2U3DPQ9_PURLI|nr:hypothetical protein PCL_11358 [Purpureocillium lilacinum]
MVDVSVGQAAGIIAAAIVVARLLCPLGLTFLLACLLRDTETASTWSLANQTVQASLWPMLVGSDTSRASHKAHRHIRLLSASLTALAILGAIVGVVTPLGLSEKLVSLREQAGTFEYSRDSSSYSRGTSLRRNGSFHRHCSYGDYRGWAPCPYTGDIVEKTKVNGTFHWKFPSGLQTTIPSVLRDIFSSGTAGQPTTISNFFDIEWRQLSTTRDTLYNNGTEYEIGLYRQLDSILLQDEYKVLEGLVVDNKIGGVGFRNHTVPTGLDRGATWKEDLLFIEPEASCVNTNLTFDFEISTNFSDLEGYRNLVITDRGGFVDINTTYLSFGRPKAQSNPDLQARAYEAAILNNAYTMITYNITDPGDDRIGRPPYSYLKSVSGAMFPLNATSPRQFASLRLSTQFGTFMDMAALKQYRNPYNVTPDTFKEVNNICTGADKQLNSANISNVYIACGLMQGAPLRVDSGSPSIFDNGSKWSTSLHACAATVRATIKTVSFAFNATRNVRGLEGLTVTGIEPKVYGSEDDYPIWGFEESGLPFEGISPIWGLISPEHRFHQNVSFVRHPFFNIPGVRSTVGSLGTQSNNLAGSSFAAKVMDQVFNNIDLDRGFDLLGTASMSVFERWQSLSPDATKASNIIKLLWTDLATSAVVGTKGVLGHLNNDPRDKVTPVYIAPLGHSITYDIVYGIPAFLLLLLMAITGIMCMIAICFSSANIARLRCRLQQMSTGRIYTTYLYPEQSSLSMPSKQWAEKNGSLLIRLTSIGQAEGRPALDTQSRLQEARQSAEYAQPVSDISKEGPPS